MNSVLAGAGALLVLRLGAELLLSARNRAAVRRGRADPPPGLVAVMDEETRLRSAAYTLAKSTFGSWSELWETAVLAALLFCGFLPRLQSAVASLGAPGAAWTDALFVLAALAVLGVAGLPWDWHAKFGIEARFGFNRSTPGLWIADRIKGWVLAAVLGFPLLWALFALMRAAGPRWWIWGFALMLGVQLLLIVVYPMLILPLFNRLTPLPEGELRRRLLDLADRTGFRATTIQVVDGSRRSSHSNAFFTGFGRFRRIVLFDTLLAQLDPKELEAVLAHEIGHYRLGHIPKGLALAAAMTLAGFWAASLLIPAPWFAPAFGFASGSPAPGALLCVLLGGSVTYWISPFLNGLSRRHEYEADAFAGKAVGGPSAMVAALRKITKDNLGNLTPDPWFGAFHFSHPTFVEREAALAGGGPR